VIRLRIIKLVEAQKELQRRRREKEDAARVI
jgi:hypothetical protein